MPTRESSRVREFESAKEDATASTLPWMNHYLQMRNLVKKCKDTPSIRKCNLFLEIRSSTRFSYVRGAFGLKSQACTILVKEQRPSPQTQQKQYVLWQQQILSSKKATCCGFLNDTKFLIFSFGRLTVLCRIVCSITSDRPVASLTGDIREPRREYTSENHNMV